MAWMREVDRDRLRDELQGMMRSPVELSVSVAENEASVLAVEVLDEIASLSKEISLVRTAPHGLDPTIEVRGRNRGRVAFVGLPMGYEFPTLIDAVRDASLGRSSVAEEIRSEIAAIRSPRRIKVFTTPT